MAYPDDAASPSSPRYASASTSVPTPASAITVGCLDSNSSASLTGSLTGSWNAASTAAVNICHNNTGGPFPGTTAHHFIIDRALSLAEVQWLRSVAFGG